MIITEDIRKLTNYIPMQPLQSQIIKDYYEHFALVVLEYFEPERYASYEKIDAPDLQHPSKKAGVEVTAAVSNNDATISGNYTSYRMTNDDAKRERLDINIKRFGGKIDDYGLSYPTKTHVDERSIIQTAISRKNKKLPQYKLSGFENMELFIVFDEPLCPVSMESLKRLFETSKNDPCYERVFLCFPCALLSFQPHNEKLEIHHIPDNDYDCLKIIARLNVEKEFSIPSSEWVRLY